MDRTRGSETARRGGVLAQGGLLVVGTVSALSACSAGDEKDDLFAEADARYEDCVSSVRPFYAEGEASDASAEAFDECWVDGDARQVELRNLASNGITFGEPADVLWSRPESVTDERVTIEQCVADGTVLKDGEELPPAGPSHPYLLHISLVKRSGGLFKIEEARPVLDGEEHVTCD